MGEEAWEASYDEAYPYEDVGEADEANYPGEADESEAWESEAWEGEGFPEGDIGEGLRRRRRRARATVVRRRPAQLAPVVRPRPPAPVRPAPVRGVEQQAVAAMRTIMQETQVREASVRRALAEQEKRQSLSQYSTVLNTAREAYERFIGSPDSDLAKAAMLAGPLLLLQPQRKRPGLEGFLTSPVVLGALAVGGMALYKAKFASNQRDLAIEPQRVDNLACGNTIMFIVRDRFGSVITDGVTWTTNKPDVATIDGFGVVTGVGSGYAWIKATRDGASQVAVVQVVPGV